VRILVVEDDPKASSLLVGALAAAGWEIESAFTGNEAHELLGRSAFDAVVADVGLPGMSGIELARSILHGAASAPRFILVSGQDNIIESVNSLELGVEDFLPKPLNLKHLLAILRRIERKRAAPTVLPATELQRHLAADKKIPIVELPEPRSLLESGQASFIGVYGPSMLAVCEQLRKVAPYPEVAVLIEGETGTGKELVARYVSMADQADEGPFVGLNCSLFNSELFAAELFGYERGTFTGADQHGKKGKLDLAAGGCMFLDEITEMSPELQARFLRVLQERNYYRLGGDKLIKVSCRFVLATNRDVVQLVEQGLFRQDLFYRLSICHIKVPPLRKRKEEILPLAIRFMKSIYGSWLKSHFVETAAFDLLERYNWPGNARQLQNIISSWGLFELGDTLTAATLSELLDPRAVVHSTAKQNAGEAPKTGAFSFNDFTDITIPDEPFKLADLEAAIVQKTLKKFGGNKLRTSEFLGISRSQLYGKYST